MLLSSCVYPWLFESRTPPNARKLSRYPRTPGPFVLEPFNSHYDVGFGTQNLGLILFGQANDQLPYVLHALERAGRGGLTAKRVKLNLMDVQVERRVQDAVTVGVGSLDREDEWSTIHESGGQLATPQPQPLFVPASPEAVRVRLLTPLRIRRDNHLVDQRGFDFRSLAGVLLRRISLLTNFFGDTPLETDFAGLLRLADSLNIRQRKLHWREWARYSSKQETKLQMGGLVGWFEVEGLNLEPFWPYLWLGQWTHAGKVCSMGLGRYVLEPAGGAADSRRACWASPQRL